MILERQIRRNLRRNSRARQKNSEPCNTESQANGSNNRTESFTSDCDGDGKAPFFPVANIDGIRNGSCRNVCGSYHYYHCRLGCPPSVAWWKSRKSTASMIVSVPVRRIKKRKKKCLRRKLMFMLRIFPK